MHKQLVMILSLLVFNTALASVSEKGVKSELSGELVYYEQSESYLVKITGLSAERLYMAGLSQLGDVEPEVITSTENGVRAEQLLRQVAFGSWVCLEYLRRSYFKSDEEREKSLASRVYDMALELARRAKKRYVVPTGKYACLMSTPL